VNRRYSSSSKPPPTPPCSRPIARPLTEAEVVALVGFLEEADAKKAEHQAPPYAALMLGAGVVGSILLLGLYTMIWGGRKKGSVNQEIYDRQVQSA